MSTKPMITADPDKALMLLRVQLFTAAQGLTGDHLVQFWQLVDEIQTIRPPEMRFDGST